ncbi:conserved hypothetical protein [uncultured Desulfatiglans sp.]|nr:conserved hypothetical protein [uncultured Desulfatiglans sp.]
MENPIVPPGDDFEIRCPRLGHQISFAYCRRENHGLPCSRTLICWHPYFPVEAFLRTELTQEEWDAVFEAPPRPKLLSLVELIEKAKERNVKK